VFSFRECRFSICGEELNKQDTYYYIIIAAGFQLLIKVPNAEIVKKISNIL